MVDNLVAKIRKGTVNIELNPAKTFKIPKNGKFYYYSIINKQLRLVKFEVIPDQELSKWYNANWDAERNLVATK